MNALVARLAQGEHPITLGGPEQEITDLKKRIEEIGYVFIKFTDTLGGTDLGVHVDSATTQIGSADFLHATGMIHIEGDLILNFAPVRCVADINLATRQGTGHLVVVQTVHS